MPRRYQKAKNLAKFSAQLRTKTSDNGFDSSMEFPEDEEAGDEIGPEQHLQRTLENAPHFSYPAWNTGMLGQILHQQDEDEAQDFPNCSVTVPLPIFLAQDAQTPRVEVCAQRPHAYDEWMRQLHFYKASFDKGTKRMKQREKKKEQEIHDVSLYEMAEHIARQENAFFRDSYDYYYTGGNLNTLTLEGDGHLAMHVSGDKLRDLHFSEINSEAELWHPLHSAKMDEPSSELFQLLPLKSWRGNSDKMLLARFLNEVSLYELKRREDMEFESYELICHSKLSSKEVPFLSASQSLGNANTLALAYQDRSLRFLDLVTQQDIAKHDVCLFKGLKQTTSTWAQLMPAGGSTFHYLSQPVLFTVDARCGQPLNPCFASSLHSKNCEIFSCMARSVNPNLLYVASNHKLHCLDIRCLGKKLADRAVVTWTHQMTYPPSFMDTCDNDGSEYIALAGVLPTDQRICQLKGHMAKSVDEMFSPAIPFAPPSLDEALTDARLRGFVDVYADLTERVKTCLTGLRFHRLEEASDKAFAQLLTANSLGDVFCQRLTLRDEEEHVQEIRTGLHTTEAIRYYANLVHERVQRQNLRCTEVQSIPEIRYIFRESAKRSQPDEKPLIVEEIEIDYGIKDTDDESQSSQELETSKPKKNVKEKPGKKPKKKLKQQHKNINPKKVNLKKHKGISRGSWQKSAYQMSHYTDMMSIRLLDVWDMEEYDNTRDVTREMLQERLQDEQLEPEHRMANWLNQLPSQPEEVEGHPDLVPGTNLPKLYGATTAEFSEVVVLEANGPIKEPLLSPKKEPSVVTHEHSILMPGQNTIIECDFNPPPAKKLKTKFVKGF
ncbi:uncharacterized protein LOC128254936 [Drosophila gunungcola]|uniref:uncharacterized protein LOC128254936 n=1 Tax=Drosophila gunungcola TaxID=103775 RepID=UPI0022E8C6E5|nr:uncharacterized protein LOC128254936 [Drosophila gunungcola]XP_052840272.1 uncharacterized protein LOC128254936 [Drosophila gunungcola]